MSFRTKVFLAVLVPASFLVTAVVGAALSELARRSDRAVRTEFERTRMALDGILGDLGEELQELEDRVSTPWFEEFVRAVGRDRDLIEAVDYKRDEFAIHPDYFAACDADGKVYVERVSLEKEQEHYCDDSCAHDVEREWLKKPGDSLFLADGTCLLGRRLSFEDLGIKGAIGVGQNLSDRLSRLSQYLGVGIVLSEGGRKLFSSVPGVEPGDLAGDHVRLKGERHIIGRTGFLGLGKISLLRPMGEVDRQRLAALVSGGIALGLAVLVAGGVSILVARRVSRPVETLVEATQKVGGGDFTVRVDIAGRDEMGRLGEAFNGMTEGLLKRREIMEKTLTRDVAEAAMKGVALGGVRREVSILFMDVRGFTSASEGMDPAEVVRTLNDMMKGLAAAVERHGGNVNKYLGDGVMAMFGAPEDLEEHALRALRAAVDMQASMKAWNARRAGEGLPALHIGIGINTGEVLGGWVGSESRLEYTLIGEEVNLASRICGKAAPGQILITHATQSRLGEGVEVRPLDPVQVKGLSYPIKVFEVPS